MATRWTAGWTTAAQTPLPAPKPVDAAPAVISVADVAPVPEVVTPRPAADQQTAKPQQAVVRDAKPAQAEQPSRNVRVAARQPAPRALERYRVLELADGRMIAVRDGSQTVRMGYSAEPRRGGYLVTAMD